MDPNNLSALFGPGVPAQNVNLSPMTLQQMAEAGYLPTSTYSAANLPTILFSGLTAASDPANRVVVITGSAPGGLVPLGITRLPVENGSLYLRLFVPASGPIENLDALINGTLRSGVGLPVQLTLPRGLYDWQLNSQAGATLALASGLSELDALTGSTVGSLLPDGLPALAGISLTRLALQFNTRAPAISVLTFSLQTGAVWHIIPDVLDVKQLVVTLTYLSDEDTTSVTGQVAGLFTLLGRDVDLLIPIPPDEANWVLRSSPHIAIPGIGTLVSQASKLVGTGDLTAVLPPGLDTPGGFTLAFLEIIFDPTHQALLNVALTLRSEADTDWALPYASSLALANLAVDLSLSNPVDAATRVVTGAVSGVVIINSVFLPLRIERPAGQSSWTLAVTFDDLSLTLPELAHIAGINATDFSTALPSSLSIVSDLTLSQLNVIYDITANRLRDISFTLTLNDPWQIVSGYLTVNSAVASMQIYDVTTPTRAIFVGLGCELLLVDVFFILGAQNNSGTGSGWVLTAAMAEGDTINLTDLIASLLRSTLLPGNFRLPSSLPTVICTGAQIQVVPATQAFSVDLTSAVLWTVPFALTSFEIHNLNAVVDIGAAPMSSAMNARPYLVKISGQFSFIGIVGMATFATSNTGDDTLITVVISNSPTAIKLPGVAAQLTSGSQTGAETWSSLIPAVPADFTGLGTLTLALAVNLTQNAFLLYGRSSIYGSVAFLAKQQASGTWGYLVAARLAEGFRFESLLSSLKSIDGILTVTQASFVISSFADPSLQTLLASFPAQTAQGAPSPQAAVKAIVTLGANPDVASVRAGVNFYAELQFTGGLLAQVAQFVGIAASGPFTVAGSLSSDASTTEFQARLGNATLFNLLTFNAITLTYTAADTSTFILTGTVVVHVDQDYPFSGAVSVRKTANVTTAQAHIATTSAISEPLGLPKLTLNALYFSLDYIFNSTSTDSQYLLGGSVSFDESVTLDGFIYFKNTSPVVAGVRLSNLSISRFFAKVIQSAWPADLLDISFKNGMLYYAPAATTLTVRESTTGQGTPIDFQQGFHASTDIDIYFLKDAHLQVDVVSSGPDAGIVASGTSERPIDWGFIKLYRGPDGLHTNGDPARGPAISLHSSQRAFTLSGGFAIFNEPILSILIQVKRNELTGTLSLDRSVGPFGQPSFDFVWDNDGFRVTTWPLGSIKLPDFDFENIQVDAECPISGIIKLPITSRVNLTPSFSITTASSGGVSAPVLTITLNGSLDLVVNSSAYQDELLSARIVNATLAVPFPTTSQFAWETLAEKFIECMKGVASSTFDNLINDPANLAKLLAVEGIEWGTQEVLDFLVCKALKKGISRATAVTEAAAFIEGATQGLPVVLASILGVSGIVVGGTAGSKDANGHWHVNKSSGQSIQPPPPRLVASLWPDTEGWNQPQYYATIRSADIDGDGRAEILARSARGIEVAKWDQGALQWSIWPAGPDLPDTAGWNQPQYYATIQYADIDGDGRSELLARAAAGLSVWQCDRVTHQWTPLPAGPALNDTGHWDQPQYYTTIQCADIDGDGRAEVLARAATGIDAWQYDRLTYQWTQLPAGPALNDTGDWNQPQYYATIQYADIDGDGQAELLARGGAGLFAWHYDRGTRQWTPLPAGPAWNNTSGWSNPQYYTTIQCADIDGDGKAEVLARAAAGLTVWRYDKVTSLWTQLPLVPSLNDTGHWDLPQYYTTIQCADIDGDGQAEVLARSGLGISIWKYDAAHGNWIELSGGPAWSDTAGWNQPQYYTTIQCANIGGYGQTKLVARAAAGMTVYQPASSYVNTWAAVFQRAAAEPVYKTLLYTDPLTWLKAAGILIPASEHRVAVELVRLLLADAPSPERVEKQKLAQRKDSSYLSAQASWSGLTIHLSHKAAIDARNGVDLRVALAASIAPVLGAQAITAGSISGFPELASIVSLLSTYLWEAPAQIGLLDRGKGVDVFVPWLSFASLPSPGTASIETSRPK